MMKKLSTWLDQIEQRSVPYFQNWHPSSLSLISFLLLVSVGGMIIATLLLPAWRALQDENARLADLTAQTSQPASALSSPEQIEQQTRMWKEHLSGIPRGPTAGVLAVDAIREHIMNAGFDHFDVKLQGAGGASNEDIAFTIEIVGSYAMLGQWLEGVSDELPWLVPKRLEMSPATDAKANGGVLMRYHAALSAAYLKESY